MLFLMERNRLSYIVLKIEKNKCISNNTFYNQIICVRNTHKKEG